MHVMFEFIRLWLVCKVTRSLSFSLSFLQTPKKTGKSGTSLLDTVCMHIQRLSANRYSKHTLMALHILREAVGGDKQWCFVYIAHILSLSLWRSWRQESLFLLYILISYFFPDSSNLLNIAFVTMMCSWSFGNNGCENTACRISDLWGLSSCSTWQVLNVKLFYLLKNKDALITICNCSFSLVVHLFILKAKLT